MLHPNTQLKHVNQLVGNGIFATHPIPKGTIIWVRDVLDREWTPDAFYAHPPLVLDQLMTYSYRNSKGNYIFCWDNGKYINHSFTPNCMTTPYGIELVIKDIAQGEELTNDYGTLNIIEPFTPVDEGHRRKTVHPNDIEMHHPEWDAKIADALALIFKVEQPLWPLVPHATIEELHDIVDGNQSPRSILQCLYRS